MESIPVCGVEIRKEFVLPLEAPFLKSEIPVGITPHEQSGMGTPSKLAFNAAAGLDLPIYLFNNR